ncbi:beta-lactamase family protein [bacterium]|nr:beta-lactamase family protein [bacterium]
MNKIRSLSIFLCVILMLGCNSNNNGGAGLPQQDTACTDQQLEELEQSMTDTLTSTLTDTDFTLILESDDGRSYSVSTGASTSSTLYESASTSKLVTAVVILSLIDQGTTPLTLDSKPQDFISFWTPTAGTPASRITLRHLLSFTSGFMTEPDAVPPALLGCIDRSLGNFKGCVEEIYNTNINNNIEPGSQYYYSGSHLQIAGLMAINAGDYSNWTAVFNDFKIRTGLFSHSTYDLPSLSNPRLAGGMHWTGDDYHAFLRALYSGQILSAGMRAELWDDQRGAATVENSPIVNAMGEDWGYAFGNWIECRNPTFDCGTSLQRNSCPGAYGAYPFIDFENKYFGILSRQGAIGTFQNGINLFRTVEPTAKKWATRSCGT